MTAARNGSTCALLDEVAGSVHRRIGRRARRQGRGRLLAEHQLSVNSNLYGTMMRRSTEIEEDFARRKKRLRAEKAGMHWQKNIGQALNLFSVVYVVDLSRKAEFKMHGLRFAQWANTCNKTCWRRNTRCL